ncbi:MAG: hypothetical protein RL685_223 [Pseudomonadota bacterium]|jgi:peptidyl-prolyl cis-trans isomerase C
MSLGPLRSAAVLLLGGVLCWQLARAEPSAGTDPVLAQVGPLTIDAVALRARAARLTPAHRTQLGKEWPEQRRRLLEEELVPEALLHVESSRQERGLASASDQALARALVGELERVALARAASPERIALLHAERQSQEEPRALLLWRILVRSESDATALLKELGKPAESAWTRLARERSIDTATHMRGGSLGYVAASGQTHMPQVRVAAALFAAADQVEDGKLVPRPVPEGEGFAVVWRRASRAPAPALPSSPSAVAGSTELAAQLITEAVASDARTLTEKLRAEQLRDYRPELVAGIEARSVALEPVRPGGTAPVAPRPVTLAPRATDSGLR